MRLVWVSNAAARHPAAARAELRHRPRDRLVEVQSILFNQAHHTFAMKSW